MKHVLHILGSIALLAVAWLAGELAWTIRETRPHLEVTLENLDRTIIIAGAAATHLEKASGTWEASSKQQSAAVSLAASNVNAAVVRFTSFISSTDNSVNSQLMPALTTSIEQQNAALLDSQKDLQSNLVLAQKVLSDTDAQINSPDIKIALDNVATSSQNLATATREGAASMTDIHAALDYEIRQLEAPVTKLKAAGMIALTVIRKLYF